jgi:octaheme c-type cytochrome (tetrathionate reductase family)
MRRRYVWILGLAVTLALILIPIVVFFPRSEPARDDPAAALPVRKPSTDHQPLLPGPYASGQQVTQACLECHAEEAGEVMQTVHWTWESKPYQIPGHNDPVTIGKKNSLNNFCIGIQSNWAGCTSCHAGYGWEDAEFDFADSERIDCLVCHDNTGTYLKADAGLPAEGVDLAYVAQSVTWPTRENCGSCHFAGGGGNAVKHGDLDQHLIYPTEDLDVHMGGQDMVCTDCHQTEDHQIRGRAISVSFDLENQAACTDCHSQAPHEDDRINTHLASVACQTCHVPAGGAGDPTKMTWDWSTAGQDRPEDEHEYLKIKGSFFYEGDFTPEYHWYNGISDRYIMGDTFDPSQPLNMNPLAGDIDDPEARIFPFKVHRAKQPYDTVYNYLLQPKTFGEGGFWTEFDWDKALRLGSEAVGLPFSGEYGFADTEMYWPLTHTVAPAGEALLCADCHSPNGRLDWEALGYPGDPMEWGVRSPAPTDETAQVMP